MANWLEEDLFPLTLPCYSEPFPEGCWGFSSCGTKGLIQHRQKKQHRHQSYREGIEKHDPLCGVFEMLTQENKLANGFVFIYFL